MLTRARRVPRVTFHFRNAHTFTCGFRWDVLKKLRVYYYSNLYWHSCGHKSFGHKTQHCYCGGSRAHKEHGR